MAVPEIEPGTSGLRMKVFCLIVTLLIFPALLFRLFFRLLKSIMDKDSRTMASDFVFYSGF